MNASSKEKTAPAAVKSADRTVMLLEVLAASPHAMTLTELQQALDVPKSSLYMLLQTLVARGWLSCDLRLGTYGIGVRALLVGTSYLDQDPVVQAAAQVISELRVRINETVHLARLDGGDVVYLASRESQHHLRVISRVGRRVPAYATSLGKALLAARSDAEVDALLPAKFVALTENTVRDRRALHRQLAEVRARGYAFEREENTPGLCCFAVALPHGLLAQDAISCSVPLARLDPEHERQVLDGLFDAARAIGAGARRGV
ncbi:IclR family transcriptional regulator [Lysobacter enzymogenes]|uniref:IclR family transcriptional regulator n=1 Tax=Lysobacter enzymogenes TaxID=69 RepID=UPI000895670A|nr:IclR family transcriptional regulator [Lysobacter enzymogenes]SDX02776.1 DNA-binding transcriptional regulator, IclR family [Lysobacter enzymogenes]